MPLGICSGSRRVLQPLLATLSSSWDRFSEALAGPVRATGAFTRHFLQLSSAALHKGLRSLVPHSSTNVVDSEAQPLDRDLNVLAENDGTLTLHLPDIPTGNLEAPSVMWLLETSTDPEVFIAAARLVPQVEWPLDFDVSDMLHQLFDIFNSCVDIQAHIVPSLKEKASACVNALTHLYYGCVLQDSGHGDFIARGRSDSDVLLGISMVDLRTPHHKVLGTAMNFCDPSSPLSRLSQRNTYPDSVSEQLSHLLPYHFVTGQVNEGIEDLAMTVISKLLSSPSSPSNQIVANCILLACVMVGTQVDKKDIVRIDKSSALHRLRESFLTQFQKVLWAWDGGKYSMGVTRRTWNLLDIICRIIELAGTPYPGSSEIMHNLDVCRNIYLGARSSKQNYASVSLATLRKILHFTFAITEISRDPAKVWEGHFRWKYLSYSPEDFDWAVDYLDFIYSDDHEAAYDILLLLSSVRVCCSLAKKCLFIERLAACMDGDMPHHLRHVALCAAYSAREEIASIDTIDDARLRDMLLTKLSPAILSVVCLHTGTDDHDRSFYRSRDTYYLELVFALTRNSDWHPHLSGDGHIDRCISMIPEYCNSGYNQHAFYIGGILLRIADEQKSVTSLDSVTEQQWWDVMRSAWNNPPFDMYDAHFFELLLILVDGTKKYMQIASKDDLEWLIRYVASFVEDWGQVMQDMGQGIAIAAVEELNTAAKNMLDSFGQQLLVP
ncbi:hypothetical protein EV424DRAFT_572899 [Suillus variegatus]|nr:hypothetical protein EV424DRAFT_572899 [Suillus variegatus]